MDELEWRHRSRGRAGRRRIRIVFVALRDFREGLGMKLAREIFDRGSNSRSGAIDSVADDCEAAVLYGVEHAPARTIGEGVRSMRGIVGMRFGEDKEFRLEVDDFFEIDLRPGLGRVYDRNSAGVLEGVGDECVVADGDEGFGPN